MLNGRGAASGLLLVQPETGTPLSGDAIGADAALCVPTSTHEFVVRTLETLLILRGYLVAQERADEHGLDLP